MSSTAGPAHGQQEQGPAGPAVSPPVSPPAQNICANFGGPNCYQTGPTSRIMVWMFLLLMGVLVIVSLTFIVAHCIWRRRTRGRLPVVQNTVDRDVEVGRCQVPVKQGVVVTHPDGGLDIAMMVIVDDKGKVMPSPAAAAASGQSHCCISAPGCHTALCAQPATRPALPTTCTPQVTPGGATGWGVPSPQQGLPQDLQPQCHQTEAQCPMSEAGKDQQVAQRCQPSSMPEESASCAATRPV